MNWRRHVVISIVLALGVVLALMLVADVRRTLRVIRDFRWVYVIPVVGFTLLNYALRFLKWHYYLYRLGIRSISWGDSWRVFVANFVMVMTPGKVGEVFKAYLLKQVTGTPMARSAPIVLAERLTDGLAMAFLATVGLASYAAARTVVLVVVMGMMGFVVAVQVRPFVLTLLEWGSRLPHARRLTETLRVLYESTYQLLRWEALIPAVILGFISWGGEGIAFYLILLGLGLDPSWSLLAHAVFILSFATIVGAVSALPGGLGAAEGSLTGLLLLLVTSDESLAVAATLLIRLFTLWFGVLLGAMVLVVYRRRFWPAAVPQEMLDFSLAAAEGDNSRPLREG